jgi:hypothetical protein
VFLREAILHCGLLAVLGTNAKAEFGFPEVTALFDSRTTITLTMRCAPRSVWSNRNASVHASRTPAMVHVTTVGTSSHPAAGLEHIHSLIFPIA